MAYRSFPQVFLGPPSRHVSWAGIFHLKGPRHTSFRGPVVNNDYTGEIKILASATLGSICLSKGQRIAQALPLPLHGQYLALGGPRGVTEPGSSDIYWIQAISRDRPTLHL